MTIEEMKAKRIELGYSYSQLSELSQVPLGTIQKIFGGITEHPRRETLVRIQKALLDDFTYPDPHPEKSPVLKDSHAAAESYAVFGDPEGREEMKHFYPRQGQYTLKDYYALPDDQRVELIDGVFYDMAAPSGPHQIIGGEIYYQLLGFQKKKKEPCLPMISPVDVQLDRDDRTMVQPDVLILCDREKLYMRCVYGAPDYIAEVLSPSTRKKDMILKLSKYSRAGVREYWMIDAGKRTVVVYDLEHDAIPAIWSFTDDIPVGIWDGECTVNLSDTIEELDRIGGRKFKNEITNH